MSDELYMRFYDEEGTYVARIIGVGPTMLTRPGKVLVMNGRRYRLVGPITEEEIDGTLVPVADIQTIAWQ